MGRMRRDLELVAGGGRPGIALLGKALKVPNTGTSETNCGGCISDGVPTKGETALRDNWRGLTI